MNEEKILKKAIEKAVENGYRGSWNSDSLAEKPKKPYSSGEVCEAHSPESEGDCLYTTIFNHGFVKAFFGEEEICDICEESWEDYCDKHQSHNKVVAWEHYIQKMAIDEQPLDIIKKLL